MRKTKYLKLPPEEVKRQGTVVTARFDDAEQVLIMDIFMDRYIEILRSSSRFSVRATSSPPERWSPSL